MKVSSSAEDVSHILFNINIPICFFSFVRKFSNKVFGIIEFTVELRHACGRRNQGMPAGGAKNFKKKCAKCSATLLSNTVPVRCSVRNKGFHQKCGTGPKASNSGDYWEFDTCTKFQQIWIDASNFYQLPASTNSIASQPQPATSRNKLKIYQWNATGIYLKCPELCVLLFNSGIDVLAVTESKLCKSDKTPFVEGYATVQKDCSNVLRGGLLLFIRTNMISEKLHSFEKAGMAILYICLTTTESSWLELYNKY